MQHQLRQQLQSSADDGVTAQAQLAEVLHKLDRLENPQLTQLQQQLDQLKSENQTL